MFQFVGIKSALPVPCKFKESIMDKHQFKFKYIYRQVRQACLSYGMITDGDKIAAGMSGGKDSMAMLALLALLQKYTPRKFEIVPVYIDLGWDNDITGLYDLCKSLGLSLVVEKTNIGVVVFKARQEKNPCSLCSNLRHGALNRVAKKLGCNKVALGHHLDDAVNTMFMSMLFTGRLHVFKPLTYLDRMDLTVIRPLVYVEESEVRNFCASLPFPVAVNNCPADGYSKRTEIAELMAEIEARYPGARRRCLKSLENAEPECFWQKN